MINAIAWDKAYCLYAKGTLEDRRSLICRKGGGPSHETARQKYIDRGWDITSLTPGSNGLDPSFSVGPRWVGDTQTWTIHLDIEGVSPPPAITPSSTPLTTNILAPCSWILHSFEPTSNKMLYEVVRIPHFSAFNYAMINAEARRVFVQMIRKHPELIEGPSFPIQEGRV